MYNCWMDGTCVARGARGAVLAAGSAISCDTGIGYWGRVTDAQGAVVPVRSSGGPRTLGTSYEAVAQADGRFAILGMRVGGPYKVTAELSGFGAQADAITVNLGTATDLEFTLGYVAALTEQVTVLAAPAMRRPIQRTGQSTAAAPPSWRCFPRSRANQRRHRF